VAEQYKTAWVVANGVEIKKKVTVRVKIGSRKVQKRKGLFASEMIELEEDVFENREEWHGTGQYSDRRIDNESLAQRIAKVCNDYWNAGYELVQSIDTLEGRYNFDWKTGGIGTGVGAGVYGYGYGYGYSMTDGVVLLFRRRAAGS
jgi:hypothetical protein